MQQTHGNHSRIIIGLTCLILIFGSTVVIAADQPLDIPLFGLTISGMGLTQTLGNSDVNASQAEIAFSFLTLTAGYKLTYYDAWVTFTNLSAGTSSSDDGLMLEEFALGGVYGGEINSRWSYFVMAAGSRAAERNADEAYWGGVLGGAATYTLSDHWNLLGGTGVLYTNAPLAGGKTEELNINHEILPLPVFGVQWNQQAESGWAVSLIFPMEAKLSYRSADQKLSSSVDFLTQESEVSYQFTPRFTATLHAQYTDEQVHRLASNNLILPENVSEAYLKNERSRVELMLGTNVREHAELQVGPYYLFNAETTVIERGGDVLHKLDNDDAFGGKFALAVTF